MSHPKVAGPWTQLLLAVFSLALWTVPANKQVCSLHGRSCGIQGPERSEQDNTRIASRDFRRAHFSLLWELCGMSHGKLSWSSKGSMGTDSPLSTPLQDMRIVPSSQRGKAEGKCGWTWSSWLSSDMKRRYTDSGSRNNLHGRDTQTFVTHVEMK